MGHDAEYYREYRRRNLEGRRAYERAYREAHREEENAKVARYKARHPDRVRASLAAWRDSDKGRAWASAYRLRASANNREWYVRHHAAARFTRAVNEMRRRTRKINNGGTATPEQVAARIAYFGWKCWMCGGPWEAVDHVKPLVLGGTSWPANLRPSCRSCNASKGGRAKAVA